jgi:hypothetical protein
MNSEPPGVRSREVRGHRLLSFENPRKAITGTSKVAELGVLGTLLDHVWRLPLVRFCQIPTAADVASFPDLNLTVLAQASPESV